MSTQINVTVDSGGLADEDKQQRQSMRWAKLEKDGKSLVYRTGLDERGKALNQQGKDPTGKPKPSTPAPVLRRDEPAAFRFGKTLPYFYFLADYDSTTGSWTYTITSGNRNLTQTYVSPALVTIENANLGTRDTSKTGFASEILINYGTGTGLYPDLIRQLRRGTEIDYSTYSSDRRVSWCAPLGNGKAILVIKHAGYVERTDWTHITYYDRYVNFDNTFNASHFISFEKTYTDNPIQTWDEAKAYIVGYDSLQEITVPPALNAALNTGFWGPVNQESGSYGLSEYVVDSIGNKIGYPVDGDPILEVSYTGFVYSQNPNDEGNYDITFLPQNYGFRTGLYRAFTPINWYQLDTSVRYALRVALVGPSDSAKHDAYRPQTIDGVSVATAIGTKYMAVFDNNQLVDRNPYKWLGDAPTGTGYPSLTATPVRWEKDSSTKIKKQAASQGGQCFIYDWGNPGFCRQQAAKYGL
jgi:hypothetical protein